MSATANRTDTTYTFGVITPEEFDRLSEATSQGSFQQWSGQVRLAKIRGHEAECVGVCDASGNLVAGCVILYLNGRFGADGSVYFGPIGISDDPALLRAITEAIRESARRHHAVSVACWPNVAYRLYSSDGQPDGEPNDALLTGFTDAGWTHGGFHTGYDVVCQWMYVKDLTGITNGKELLASFGKRAQWSVKRAQSMGVHVREIGPDEFDVFADIERRTGERRGFATRGADYFRQFKQAYGADAHFILAEIHIAEYVADMTAKREALQARLQLDCRRNTMNVRPRVSNVSWGRNRAISRPPTSVWLRWRDMPRRAMCCRQRLQCSSVTPMRWSISIPVR